MAATIVFVHGTGVRNDKTHELLRDGLSAEGRSDIKVIGVSWGDALGVSFTDGDIAGIIAPSAKSLDGRSDEMPDEALWEMLLEDPLFELGLMAIRADPNKEVSSGIGGGAKSEIEIFRQILSNLSPETPTPDGVKADEVKAAGNWLAKEPILADAVRAAAGASDDGLISASARALAAHILSEYDPYSGEGPLALYDAGARNGFVDYLEITISPTRSKSVGDWVKRHTIDALANWGKRRAINYGTKLGRKNRTKLMDFATPFTGDILLYEKRGKPFRDMIIKAINDVSADRKVVVVGHSLGGVIAVDVACEVPEKISCLITVGSQPSFFLLADSLDQFRRNKGFTSKFPEWLNIFDRNDFLSFRGRSIFPQSIMLTDKEATSGVGFPAAHGAYWRNQEVFRLIAEKCPQ